MKKIREQNIFWEDSEFLFLESKMQKRDVYKNILKNIGNNFIIIISWLRRLWKTTILKQIINKKLEEKINPKKIFFYSFSNIDTDLENILNWYLEVFLNKLYRNGENIYIFLDELQYVKNWQDIIKFWYDLYPNICFVISWSTSLWIWKNKESLLGRFVEYNIKWLSFEEFLSFKWYGYFKNIRFNHSFDEIKNIYSTKSLYKDLFNEYLTKWEFPWLIKQDYEFVNDFIKDSIIKVIFEKDIFIFDEKINSSVIYSIYQILLNNVGSFLSKTNIATKIWISKYNLAKNIEILEKSFLIEHKKNFLQSEISKEKSYKKTFSTINSLVIAWLWFKEFDDIHFLDFKWHLVENYIFTKLSLLYKEIYYYNKTWNEVDFVVIDWKNIYPIEIKIKSKIWHKDISPILTFAKKHNLQKWFIFYSWEIDRKVIDWIEIILLPFTI